ncbi:DUF3416 domain-containing protein [Corynebacterium uropygiale]|uniref:Alpha-1,4-glucan:maltose-1-phosphate maltosyltransferase n=1 Tax=Corynebacterium uropygiale TaxID=1775911 RepID=A0A9X1QP27_9CORY|nr:maltotransferase domain-containing protein [Corynebacterium uropygiale]MCF4006972.1 DUF3416 domain-containing protein [Corynebacterium uropygiale]
MSGQIDDVRPEISGATVASKAVVGEVLPITALVWREGHDAVGATLTVHAPGESTPRHITMTQDRENVDRVHAIITPDRVGTWTFQIDAWSDPMATWRWAVSKKLEAGQDEDELANDLAHGIDIFRRAAAEHTGKEAAHLRSVAEVLAAPGDLHERVAQAMSPETLAILHAQPLREEIRRGTPHAVSVERREALVNSWYELFPRSTGGWDEDGNPVHGTFATTAKALDRVAAMGFDTVYFPPIHPIGRINRKGRNNTLTPEPGDVGSPWAIGAKEGGHDAIHPKLGTEKDFVELLHYAKGLGLEVALDLALQAAPDHPWATEHPEFFTILADGTIAYAENPPKKYQDIYPLNFFNAPKEIYQEILRVVRHWVDLGVTTFRVDNPHTKPAEFWSWLIKEVHSTNPEVIFLAEAFTRPARLYGLAKAGFSQSYTYFTWKVTKEEITEFATDMAEMADVFRPNLFVNTPDILHASLQYGGRAMFAIRAALAATLSPLWGVYSGYELYENRALKPGSEEYLDSEKYQLKPRNFELELARGNSLEPYITSLNAIRRNNPALQQLRTLHFHEVDNEHIIAYSKVNPTTGNAILVVVNLDPRNAQEATVHLDLKELGLASAQDFPVHDLVTGATYTWSTHNFVRLEPMRDVAHIFRLPTVAEEDREEIAYRTVTDYRP